MHHCWRALLVISVQTGQTAAGSLSRHVASVPASFRRAKRGTYAKVTDRKRGGQSFHNDFVYTYTPEVDVFGSDGYASASRQAAASNQQQRHRALQQHSKRLRHHWELYLQGGGSMHQLQVRASRHTAILSSV